MNELISQLESKLFELEQLENQLNQTISEISTEAKNNIKYAPGQLIPYSHEDEAEMFPEGTPPDKSYSSYDSLPDSYKSFHSFAEYAEGYSAPHGYPGKEYDLGINTRFSGIFFELLLCAPLCLIGGLIVFFPVTLLTDMSLMKSYILSSLFFGILLVLSLMREKIKQNNAAEPLNDPQYIAEKTKYESLLEERNKKLDLERETLDICNKNLAEIQKTKHLINESIKMAKKDGN